MTTKPRPCESRMLTLVRQWRAEAYEADKDLTPQERASRREALLRRLGLKKSEPRQVRKGH